MSEPRFPAHALAPDPASATVPRYPERLDAAALPEHLRDNAVMQLYLRLAPQYEAEFAEMAAADAAEDEAVALALVANAR